MILKILNNLYYIPWRPLQQAAAIIREGVGCKNSVAEPSQHQAFLMGLRGNELGGSFCSPSRLLVGRS